MLPASKASNTPLLSHLRGVIGSPVLHHNLVHLLVHNFVTILVHNVIILVPLDHLSLPQDITRVHYTDDVMLTGPSKQEVATTLDLLVRYLCQGMGDKPDIQASSTSVKFLGV